jgi:hypothetical protein
MERKNTLGLDSDDLENLHDVIDDLVTIIATMNVEEYTESHIADFHNAADYANFVLKGIIYKNGFDPCAGHGHDDEEDDDDV